MLQSSDFSHLSVTTNSLLIISIESEFLNTVSRKLVLTSSHVFPKFILTSFKRYFLVLIPIVSSHSSKKLSC